MNFWDFTDFTDSEPQAPMTHFRTFTDSTGSETQAPHDMAHLEAVYGSPPSQTPDGNSFKWKVQLIDDDGNIEGKMVASRDVWKLQNSKVIVHFDVDTDQPVDDSGGLLGSWLGQCKLSNDLNLLPIDYSDWILVNPDTKDRALEVIQSKFWFDDPAKRKHYVISALGSRCKDIKLRFWRKFKRDNKAEMIQNRPKSVPENQWFSFVNTRFTDKWKKMQDRNKKNNKNHTSPHTIKNGKPPSRVELFVAKRTKPDGSYVSDQAKTQAEALTTLMNQNSSMQTICNVTASLDDEYAQVFGPERSGRVRCVGRGPTPSKFLRRSIAVSSETENSEIAQLKMQNKGLEDQVRTINTLFQKMFGVASVDQASTWASNFAAALANISNSPNTELTGVGRINGSHNAEE